MISHEVGEQITIAECCQSDIIHAEQCTTHILLEMLLVYLLHLMGRWKWGGGGGISTLLLTSGDVHPYYMDESVS